jgi:hypothetical protein
MIDFYMIGNINNPIGELKMRDIDASEADEMRLEDLYLRRYRTQLANHPDCRDPDHPTCELCEENDDDA